MILFNKYIIQKVPKNSHHHELLIPYSNNITYYKKAIFKILNKTCYIRSSSVHFVECKHIKPNTGVRYKIMFKIYKYLIIKKS